MAPTFPEKNVEKNLEEGMFPWLTVDKKMTLDKEKLRTCNIYGRYCSRRGEKEEEEVEEGTLENIKGLKTHRTNAVTIPVPLYQYFGIDRTRYQEVKWATGPPSLFTRSKYWKHKFHAPLGP